VEARPRAWPPLLSLAMMPSTLLFRVAAILAVVFTAAAFPAAALAHQGGQPFLHVPVDHIVPGESFPVVAADLGPDSTVTIQVTTPHGSVPLGTVAAGPEGHFETVLVMPTTVPEGYLEVSARSDDGSVASVWVLVGAAASAPLTTGSTGDGLWIDRSLLLLLGVVVLALAAWFIGSRRAGSSARPRG
jgi:hypothetical protein